MCGGFAIAFRDPEIFSKEFDVEDPVKIVRPSYNVRPGQDYPVVVWEGSHNTLRTMRWGLVPSWSKESHTPYSTFNARIETLAEKSTYRRPFKKSRCLVPATGYYEWQKQKDGKQPYYVHTVKNHLLAFAGLYDTWEGQRGEQLESFTIITKPATGIPAKIHDRMPAIMPRKNFAAWLNPEIDEPEEARALLQAPLPDLSLDAVSKKVNSARNNSPDLIVPIV